MTLNLAEGAGKGTKKDSAKFYNIALGSLREVQAVLALENLTGASAHKTADHLGASIYKLWKRT